MTRSGKPVSRGPRNVLNAFGRAKPNERSRHEGSTERGRGIEESRNAAGGGNRPDVPERVRAAAAVRTRRGAVLSSASESAVGFLGADEPPEPSPISKLVMECPEFYCIWVSSIRFNCPQAA